MARVAAALLLAALCACAAGGALAKPGLEAASNSTVGALLGAATPALEALEALRANKTAQAAQKLDGPAHQVLDFGAGISNGLAGAAAQILGPKVGPANASAHAAMDLGEEAVRGGVGLIQGGAQAAADAAEAKIMPLRDQIHNATAGIRREMDEFRAHTMRTIIAANTYFGNLRTNLTAPFLRPFQPAQEQINGFLARVLRWQVERMIEAGEAAASGVNVLDAKFNTTEDFIHSYVDPADAAAKGKRDLAWSSLANITAPLTNLAQKIFPELTRPQLSTIFGGIFGNLPPPPAYNITADPPRDYDPVFPSSADGSGDPSGQCVPWEVPAGYKHVNDFCKAMQQKPPEYFAKMWNSSIPTKGDEFTLQGCVFGCIVGNDSFTQTQAEFSEGFGWSGKCFSEERVDGTPKRFASVLNRNYQAMEGFSQEERISAFTGAGPFVFGGDGSFAKSYYDHEPTFRWVDDRPEPGMFTAGGWRSLYTLFQMVADGVTDDMRNYAPGWIIGKSFYARPQGIVPQKWRTPVDTNFFFLFQSCTKDGKVPWRPEDRHVPLIGGA